MHQKLFAVMMCFNCTTMYSDFTVLNLQCHNYFSSSAFKTGLPDSVIDNIALHLLSLTVIIYPTERGSAVLRWLWYVSQILRSMPKSTSPRQPGTTTQPEQTSAAPGMTICWPTNGRCFSLSCKLQDIQFNVTKTTQQHHMSNWSARKIW